jgi:hypothetical protein
MPETIAIKDQAVSLVTEFAADKNALSSPFSRSGITAKRLAEHLGFFKGPGKADTMRAKALLKSLISEGRVVSGGKERTLHAGSAYTEVYLPVAPQATSQS